MKARYTVGDKVMFSVWDQIGEGLVVGVKQRPLRHPLYRIVATVSEPAKGASVEEGYIYGHYYKYANPARPAGSHKQAFEVKESDVICKAKK